MKLQKPRELFRGVLLSK